MRDKRIKCLSNWYKIQNDLWRIIKIDIDLRHTIGVEIDQISFRFCIVRIGDQTVETKGRHTNIILVNGIFGAFNR